MSIAFADMFPQSRSHGRRYGLIIISEGAKDRDGKKITAEEIRVCVPSSIATIKKFVQFLM